MDLGLVTSIRDDSARDGTEYWYAVKAVNVRGSGVPSDAVSVSTPPQESTPEDEGYPVWLVYLLIVVLVVVVIALVVLLRRSGPPPSEPSVDREGAVEAPWRGRNEVGGKAEGGDVDE
jgi:hypothetical protein